MTRFSRLPAIFEIEEGELERPDNALPRISWTQRARQALPAWLGGGDARFQRLATEDFSEAAGDGAAETNLPPGRWYPEEKAGWMGRLLFTYVDGLLSLGAQKSLLQEDLWDVAACDAAGGVSSTFEGCLLLSSDDVAAPQGVVWRAMWRAHNRRFLVAGAVKLLHDAVMFLGPFLLEVLLRHVQRGSSGWVGLGLATALAAASVVETLTVNLYFHMLFRICLHLKTGLVDMLHRKSLRLSMAERSEVGVGAIVNLQSNDAAKLWALPQYLHMIWSGPCQILAVMALLVRVVHLVPALVAFGVTVALIPLSALVARALAAVRRRVVALTDARVKLCTEVLTGIKAIKLYAWERPYGRRIEALRQRELHEIRVATLIGTWNNLLWLGGPILISMAAFFAYSFCGYTLTAAQAFPALALFNLLRFPVMMFPTQLMNLVNAKVALDRIQRFMEMSEMKQPAALPAGDPAIVVRRGSFSWSASGPPLLHSVELMVPRGRLLIVLGAVGSGKSSLLAAILGEMRPLPGAEVAVTGSVAYTQQDPWICNATLKENILLGSALDEERYSAVLSACALLPDLDVLPARDDTEIGEKGVNLSGGQRHRVALARACYAGADAYLLDDPLSAVDARVGRHLFDRCLNGLLVGSTRVLVTHQLQYLPVADEVVIMREGWVVDRGTHAELVARGVDFHELEVAAEPGGGADVSSSSSSSPGPGEAVAMAVLERAWSVSIDSADGVPCTNGTGPLVGDGNSVAECLEGSNDGSVGIALVPSGKEALAAAKAEAASYSPEASSAAFNGVDRCEVLPGCAAQKSPAKEAALRRAACAQLTKAEERAIGQVDRQVYRRYFAAWGPAFLLPGLVLVLAVTERGLQAGQNWWLSVWSEHMAAASPAPSATAPSAEGGADDASTRLYMNVYFALGGISLLFQVVKAVALVLGSIEAARALQASLLATVLRLPMSFFDSQPTGRLLNRFTKDVEAVDTSLQSSVSSFLNCAVSVLWCLVVVVAVSPGVALAIVPLGWAYSRVQNRYIATSRELKRLDSLALSPIFSHFSETLQGLPTLRAFRAQSRFSARNAALLDESNRAYWPAQCVNRWLSVRLELLGITVVFGAAVAVSSLVPTSAGLAGLALTSALSLTGLMNWMVRQTTELEVNMNSVERLVEYDSYPPEAPEIVLERRPLPGWPTNGAISVEDLVVRYRVELDPVLRGVTFSVRPREKVGVAGRTGCGKSTLMMSLFRIVEPAAGRIVIDGIDITTIGLLDLRSRLALVPQDPIIFSGSVRSNLDPFGTAGGDEALWSALERVGLAPAVRALEGGMEAGVTEGGGNFSAGQRQLLCMARALLRVARVLVLDEATSAIDTGSDASIQATIATAFRDCTVLTIAHRLHTIIESDRVLVLDAGSVAEFGTPQELLHKPGGAFKSLVAEAARHAP